MSTLERRLRALEKLLAPQPDRWAELARMCFPVPMALAMLDDHGGHVAACRAQHIAQGHVLNDDARPGYYFRDDAECEAVCMEQQRRLISDAQADIDRAVEREAERKAAEEGAKQPPTPQRKPKPLPTFTPSTFPAFART